MSKGIKLTTGGINKPHSYALLNKQHTGNIGKLAKLVQASKNFPCGKQWDILDDTLTLSPGPGESVVGLLRKQMLENHTYFTRVRIPLIIAKLNKVYRMYFKIRPQMVIIRDMFLILSADLIDHFQRQRLLFPLLLNPSAGAKDRKLETITARHPNDTFCYEIQQNRHFSKLREMIANRDCNKPVPDLERIYRLVAGFEAEIDEYIKLEKKILSASNFEKSSPLLSDSKELGSINKWEHPWAEYWPELKINC